MIEEAEFLHFGSGFKAPPCFPGDEGRYDYRVALLREKANQTLHLYPEAGFLSHLPGRRLLHYLAPVNVTPRDAPKTDARFKGPADHKYLALAFHYAYGSYLGVVVDHVAALGAGGPLVLAGGPQLQTGGADWAKFLIPVHEYPSITWMRRQLSAIRRQVASAKLLRL